MEITREEVLSVNSESSRGRGIRERSGEKSGERREKEGRRHLISDNFTIVRKGPETATRNRTVSRRRMRDDERAGRAEDVSSEVGVMN